MLKGTKTIKKITNKCKKLFKGKVESSLAECHIQVDTHGHISVYNNQQDTAKGRLRISCGFYINKSKKSKDILKAIEALKELCD